MYYYLDRFSLWWGQKKRVVRYNDGHSLSVKRFRIYTTTCVLWKTGQKQQQMFVTAAATSALAVKGVFTHALTGVTLWGRCLFVYHVRSWAKSFKVFGENFKKRPQRLSRQLLKMRIIERTYVRPSAYVVCWNYKAQKHRRGFKMGREMPVKGVSERGLFITNGCFFTFLVPKPIFETHATHWKGFSNEAWTFA